MIKTTSITQIQYTLITSETSFSESSFHNKALRILREFPKDLLQLENTVDHFDFSFRFCLRKGLELFSLSDSLLSIDSEQAAQFFEEYSKEFNTAIIKVFIIDSKIESHENISKFLKKIAPSYFTIINDTDNSISKYNSENYFSDGTSLISLINRDRELITKQINEKYPEIEIKPWDINSKRSFFSENELVFSNLTEANYFILNQIIGNFWIEDFQRYNDDELIKLKLPAKQRINKIVSKSKTIDGFTNVMYIEKIAKQVSPFNPLCSTLILIAPFHFPGLNKLFRNKKLSQKEKAVLKLYTTEQRLDYCFVGDDSVEKHLTKEEIAQILGAMNYRLLFLDDVGYLHGLLSYSPTIRLPLVGKSINMDLSHLENFTSSRKRAVNKISKFGHNLSKLVLSDEIKEYLLKRNGQIAVISDLPIEWLYLDEFPLCYTHDVCRIPEYNQNSIVNNYIHNQRLNFLIKSDLIENALIIHCASKNDDNMQNMFNVIDSFKDDFGFNSVHCSTVKEIKDAIDSFKPELLIFDCHGGFDKSTLSSYLILDSENKIYLTGDDIIENNISAPLVFLSACSTMPNYGYVKFLSDAFMQAGAFSVTATFMPIEMADAAKLIVRLFGKLLQLKNSVIHTNWLEFISHVLRTTLIYEAIRKEELKAGIKESEIDDHKIAEILTETMAFHSRKEAITKLNDLLKRINPNFKFDFENLDNEWMSYTIIGRADLLYFENWINKFREINMNFEAEKENNNT
jgi:hypothetical protein